MEEIPQQPLEISRRTLLGAAACTALGGTFSSNETWTPQDRTSEIAEVVVANLAFISPTRPDGLAWNVSDWAYMLNHTGYDGLEAHAFNTQNAQVIGALLCELLAKDMIVSFHQSVRSDNDTSLQSKVLPTSTESLHTLYNAETSANRTLPLVVFPEGNLQAIKNARQHFTSYSAQPSIGLFKRANTASLNGLRKWLHDEEISLCWSTFHYQESEHTFGAQKLGNWQEILPDIVQNSRELGETHLEIGRIDGIAELKQHTMQELIAFINGPEEAIKTTSGQMLATIFSALPPGERTRVVVEVNQAAIVDYLGAAAIWPLRKPILNSHRRIAKTVRELTDNFKS